MIARTLRLALLLIVIFGASASADSIVLTDVTVLPSPTAEPIDGATVVVRDGRIAALLDDAPPMASGTTRIDGRGRILVAGFWNCHVHFTPPMWGPPWERDDERTAELLRSMLTRFGFTSVVDTGSNPVWTVGIERRIARGLPGPRILLAAGSFVGKGGSPAYLDIQLPELTTREQAVGAMREVLAGAPDGIKIFSGSYVGPGPAAHMTPDVVRTITEMAHARDTWVIAHPQSLPGVELAVDGGVDILAHTAPDAGLLPDDLLRRLIERDVALVPTLQLWRWELARAGAPPSAGERYETVGVGQLRQVVEAGGEVLFGTDVGYMTVLDPSDEYRLMGEAGMSPLQILAALTTAPARRFGFGSGTVAVGEAADLVLLAGDPREDVTAFARVDLTIRDGVSIFERPRDAPTTDPE